MSLDWLGRPEEAQTHFQTAAKLDPKGYFTLAMVGWHHFRVKEYAEARKWFLEAYELSHYRLHNRDPEPITTSHLRLLERILPAKGAR
jgi:Tfp pilus assembly protein PilF